ncbi:MULTISPECIES: hypothetical protein [Pseudomonas syringae group]|uniref:hypothetical protein n=1 Tax=Pseudomonas syringae group TaxID=136849 RepID=UPI000F02EEA3|nr:hypothetical protein [Pseudomonas viridiflava]MBD8572070.1 hypothetical protein [Pseudomonas syringae]
MQDENDVDKRPKIVVRNVPGEFVVDDFMDRYSDYLEAARNSQNDSGSFPLGFVSICGFALFGVGFLMMVSGPDTIRYSYATGPSFFQYLQMFSGLITTLGLLIAGVGSAIDANDNNILQTPEQFLRAHYELEFPRSINGPRLFSTVHIDGGTFKAFERP